MIMFTHPKRNLVWCAGMRPLGMLKAMMGLKDDLDVSLLDVHDDHTSNERQTYSNPIFIFSASFSRSAENTSCQCPERALDQIW